MYADFIVSMGVFTDRDEDGDLIITDALFGLEMVGEIIYNVDVQIGVEGLRYVFKHFSLIKDLVLLFILFAFLFLLSQKSDIRCFSC